MESFEQKEKRAQEIFARLNKTFPDAKVALKFGNNIQLLVAVILSAQCTDKKVNEITENLFKKYKTVDDFAKAKQEVFEKEIKSAGFYRAKAKNIIAASKIVKEKFGGEVPKAMQEILELPGVARKTANVVLGNAYGVVEGIAVDTHVKRLSNHLDLTNNTNPDKIEQDLMKLFPKEEWFKITYLLIEYGRKFGMAKNPIPCSEGPLKGLCLRD